MARRLIQDATQMVTASCDAGNRCRDCRRFSLVRARRKTAQDEHTEQERSVEQLRHDQVPGGGVRSNLKKEMELLLAEADALSTG